MRNSTLEISKKSEMSRDNVLFAGQGVNGPVPIGGNGNVDLLIPDDCFLTGGQLNVKAGNFGDGADMQVLDKDQVLKGVQIPKKPTGVTWDMVPNYPMIAQFMTNCQIVDNVQKQMDFDLDYVAKIYGGTYLRIVYRSTGTLAGNVLVGANYMLHKALY